ncbi:MAG: hypothetical protein KGS46_19765 [Chloroflexi bacterium]|nr:hypothetical protein [Chloroflexota bacterium]
MHKILEFETIPSHDTFQRVFSILKPNLIQESFVKWAQSLNKVKAGEVISLDGKKMRGSRDDWHGQVSIERVCGGGRCHKLSIGEYQNCD